MQFLMGLKRCLTPCFHKEHNRFTSFKADLTSDLIFPLHISGDQIQTTKLSRLFQTLWQKIKS